MSTTASLLQNSKRFFSSSRRVVIVGGRRTPIGTFMGGLSNMTGPQLGALATKGALAAYHVDPNDVEELIMG
jgi:acetyl-CoA C-acetyltransferase